LILRKCIWVVCIVYNFDPGFINFIFFVNNISSSVGYSDYTIGFFQKDVLEKITRNIPFDLIHANDWGTVRTGLKLRQISYRPFLFHVHSTEFERACGYGNSDIHSLEYLGMKKADCIVTVSNATADVIVIFSNTSF